MNAQHTHFTVQLRTLIDRVYGDGKSKDTLLAHANNFFKQYAEYHTKVNELNENLAALPTASNSAKSKKKGNNPQQAQVESQLNQVEENFKQQNAQRRLHLQSIAEELISLCEGESFEESNRKSAQCLGALQLLSPSEGSKVALINEQHKPLYKAVLALRLLDHICANNEIVDPYLTEFTQDIDADKFKQFNQIAPNQYRRYVENVKIPLVMAAMLQDIGNYHPQAREIMLGADGKADPFRTLPMEERKKLLQINYRETLSLVTLGIGQLNYIGNSKEERDQFNIEQQQQIQFIRQLLKSSVKPGDGIGNILKVPQIYASIVLSTKDSYNYKLLPKVYQALNQNAERGACSQAVVDALYQITGMFPQGYGITYIPNESDGHPSDFYEYAIVTQLYPDNPEEPLCRVATRQLTFVSYGQDIEISKDRNLYFIDTARRLARLSKARLNEILELLASNYHERKDLDLLPRCWQASTYFSIKKNQKLWNKRTN